MNQELYPELINFIGFVNEEETESNIEEIKSDQIDDAKVIFEKHLSFD